MRTESPPDCFVYRKHRGLEAVPGGTIYENSLVYISHATLGATETTHYLGHLFLEPKRHIAELGQLLPDEAREMGFCLMLSANALQEVCGVEHVYSFALGDNVPHVHLNVVGRYPGAPREYWAMKVDEWPSAPRGAYDQIANLAAKLRDSILHNVA
jgi:diadenosine tetraphosphate (Ap4A) HIT family hydrolase